MTDTTVTNSSRVAAELDGQSESLEPSTSRTLVLSAVLLFGAMLPVTLLVAPLKELIAVRYDASALATHSFMSINMIGAILLAPLAAVYGARLASRKMLILLSLTADAVLLAAMGYAPTLTAILVLRFFEGAAHIVAISQLMAHIAALAPMPTRGKTMGLVGTAMMLGTACGTRMGGWLWAILPGLTFQIAGGIAAITAIGVVVCLRSNCQESRRTHGSLAGLLREDRRLLIPFAYAFIDRLCVGVIVSTFVLYLGNILHLDPNLRSRMLLAFLMPFALLAYPAGRLVDRIGRVLPITLGSALFGIVFALYGWVDESLMLPVMVISGIVSAVMFAPSLALTADLSPREDRGAAFTGFNVAGSLGFTVGPLLAGAVFSIMSRSADAVTAYRATFVLTGALQIVCALLTMPFLLRLRGLGLTR